MNSSASRDPHTAEGLAELLGAGTASSEDVRQAFRLIDAPETDEEDAGSLVNAVAASAYADEVSPSLVASLRCTVRPGRAILLMRALRNRGRGGEVIPELLRIAHGQAWDPDRDAWWVAMGTLSRIAYAHPRTGLDRELDRIAESADLTEFQRTWARKCADRAAPRR